MIGVKVTSNLDKNLSLFEKQIQTEVQRNLLTAATFAASEIAQVVIKETGQGDTSKRGPTGALARSFRAVNLPAQGGKLRAGALSDLVYAGIQDQGGIIEARNVKNLAIPLINLPPGTWPRNYSGKLTFIKSKKGNKLLAEVTQTGGRKSKSGRGRTGRKTKIKPIFLLKESVTIRAKNYLKKALPAATRETRRIMARVVEKALK